VDVREFPFAIEAGKVASGDPATSAAICISVWGDRTWLIVLV
jgi:hypothetical protein